MRQAVHFIYTFLLLNTQKYSTEPMPCYKSDLPQFVHPAEFSRLFLTSESSGVRHIKFNNYYGKYLCYCPPAHQPFCLKLNIITFK